MSAIGPRRNIRRTFSTIGAGRGRPRNDAIADQDIPDVPTVFSTATQTEDRARYERSFVSFLFECFEFPDLDRGVHGGLAEFMGWERGSARPQDWLFPTKDAMDRQASAPIHAPSDTRPYGIDLEGDFRGLSSIYRGNGSSKMVLIPRNHLKSTVISVAYVLWRIVKNPAIRILLTSAVAKDARKFLKAIKWQLTQNKKIKEFWPHVHVTQELIDTGKVGWNLNEITIVRTVQYEAGEATVEAMGVGGNLVSRHYDLIICDDLVNNKNSKTLYLLEDTIEWFQNAHSLLDPVTGEVVVVGTRWDYSDLYAFLLGNHSDEYSLYFATVIGADENIFFTKKFTPETLAKIKKIHGPYKYSCQYLNQPVDRDAQDFKVSWLQFYYSTEGQDGLDNKDRPILPSNHVWHYFAGMDLAITEDGGDETALVVVAVNEKNEWYVMDVWTAQHGSPDKIIDMIFLAQEKYPEILMFGIETRGWQKTIASGANELMKQREIWINIKEMSSESNTSKRSRIMGLVPRCARKAIFLNGKSKETLKGGMKQFFSQYQRFPRGHDDILDAAAYIEMYSFAPNQPVVKSGPARTMKEKLKAHLKSIRKARIEGFVDEHTGSQL